MCNKRTAMNKGRREEEREKRVTVKELILIVTYSPSHNILQYRSYTKTFEYPHTGTLSLQAWDLE
jgi:hypothetical protein